MATTVEVRDNRELRRVEALTEDGEVAGFAQYRIGVDGSTFDFVHTEVDDRFEGEGVGSRLAAGVMDFVRGEGATIVPTCSFLREYMDRHEDTADLRAQADVEQDEADDEGARP